MKTKNEHIKTWLPVFPGFYDTIFQADETNEIYSINEALKELNKPIIEDFNKFVFDYKEYKERVSKECCSYIENELKRLKIVNSITFEKLVSPKEYNFTNDAIYCIIELTNENKKNIIKYISENEKLFNEYLSKEYTSYDGFISSYPNYYFGWVELTKNFTDYSNSHILGSILQFICDIEDINEENMYDKCEKFLTCTNYDELINL